MSKLMDFCAAVAVVSLLSFFSLYNKDASAQTVEVKEGYARETIPGTNISSAYMRIINKNTVSINLIGVSSDISNRIEIHEHTMANGMMKMRKRDRLTIHADSEVKLQPSGYHLMIFDLVKPLKAAENINLTLHFNNQLDVKVEIPVQSIKQKKQSHHHH